MPTSPEEIARSLNDAHAEALRVGDSPLRADRLADAFPAILAALDGADWPDDTKSRIRAALESAERTLRRDDDGREAARHLQAAIRLAGPRPSRPSPFLNP